ncbi:MAG TPA: response regulator [Bryobacteraceae bacterium]|nr:response regulator [Bryobacteraceae bacterium]
MKKILVADDKPSSRELIRTLLEHSGYEILEAGDGQEALDIARASAPDLILLDIHMPVLDGYGTVKAMRQDEKLQSLPIVALTASAMHSDRDRALKAGFTAYIAKPVSLKTLRDGIGNLLAAK